MNRVVPCIVTVAAASVCVAPAQSTVRSEKHSFRIETVAEGLRNPWGMEMLPDGRFLVTERPGRLRIIGADGQLQKEPVANVPEVVARGQGGLLDVRLHPNYAQNGWIYLSYSKPLRGGSLTSIIRGKLKGNALTEIQTVFDPPAEEATNSSVHFGNRIEFDGKGFMYFPIGDRGEQENAQKLENVKGKVHRLHDDGRVPADNPFVKQRGARPSIWSYGNRNIQGLRFKPGTGELYASEHGPRGGDELNLIRRGLNYGWPVITYGINYSGAKISDLTHKEGMEQPVKQWTPSPAFCGMDFYTGDKFPQWKGNLFISALALQKVHRLVINNGKVTQEETLLERTGRIRDIRSFRDGLLYVIYDEPGKIVRLVPEG
ncbi:MAG: PQQ-dependent sugar dehydrogenase [Chthoniobacterales bacterium]|nr:PQQ-dependent sugar dehydrogenase [Chthoniobacterales bacterium]